jgi:hypothetical protein
VGIVIEWWEWMEQQQNDRNGDKGQRGWWGNGKDDNVLGNMPRDVGKTFTIDVRKGVKKDTKGCWPCLLVASKKNNKGIGKDVKRFLKK